MDKQGTESAIADEYKYGFVTKIEEDTVPKGLNEDVIRFISAKKGEPEWMLEWRLKAYRWWLQKKEPRWAYLDYPPIDYHDICYYSAPKTGPAGASLAILKARWRIGPISSARSTWTLHLVTGAAMAASMRAIAVACAHQEPSSVPNHERSTAARASPATTA